MTKRGEKKRTTKRRPCNDAPGGDERRRLAAHRARCSICKHPEREEIEREFLDWVSPREIAEGWKIPSYRAIYRHAHAVGLFERRRENRLAALDSIIERVREAPVTASAVVAAIRLSRELEGEPRGGGGLGPGQKFLLSLEGLPRTDAVTGHAGSAVVGRGDPPGRPRAAAPRNASLSSQPREQAAQDGDSTSSDGAGDSRTKAAAIGVSAAASTHPAAAKADPRVALSEDGRVAGIPWPKGKVGFARRRGWRGGGG